VLSYIAKLADYFYKTAKAEPIYLYHGTSKDRLASILSQGLIPNPKERVWKEDPDVSSDRVSRESLEGIYLTDNLLTAIGAGNTAGKQKQPTILLIVEVQSQSLLMDEDNLPRLSRVYLPGMVSNEFWNCILYITAIKRPYEPWIAEAKAAYIDANIAAIKYYKDYKALKRIHPELENRFRKLLEQGFMLALKRSVSYTDDYDWKRAIERAELGDVRKPDSSQAEYDFKEFQDITTKALKTLCRTCYDPINFTARTTEPIRFSKSNKIVAILETKIVDSDSGYNRETKLIYPSSINDIPKKALDKLINDWQKQIGEFKLNEKVQPKIIYEPLKY
jgi:hypothetical protein